MLNIAQHIAQLISLFLIWRKEIKRETKSWYSSSKKIFQERGWIWKSENKIFGLIAFDKSEFNGTLHTKFFGFINAKAKIQFHNWSKWGAFIEKCCPYLWGRKFFWCLTLLTVNYLVVKSLSKTQKICFYQIHGIVCYSSGQFIIFIRNVKKSQWEADLEPSPSHASGEAWRTNWKGEIKSTDI